MLVGACVVVAVGAIATVVQASIPGPGGVISGCIQNGDGQLRVIDSTDTCKNNETSLDWNQTGPTGATGPQGPPGPVNQVAGTINPNCTLQHAITGVTVSGPSPFTGGTLPGSHNGCQITFAGSLFTNTPVLILTPMNDGGGSPTFFLEGASGPNWFAQYAFPSVTPPLVNFIATQAST